MSRRVLAIVILNMSKGSGYVGCMGSCREEERPGPVESESEILGEIVG